MLYLLQLHDRGQACQVPVADRTAVALERALLAPDRAARLPCLADAIVTDPALAVWAADEALRREEVRVTTAAEAADWLADRLAEKLAYGMGSQPSEAESAPLEQMPADDARDYATRCAAVLIAAREQRAEHAAGDLTQDAAYFAAVLTSKDGLIACWPTAPRVEERLLPAFSPVTLPTLRETELRDASAEQMAAVLQSHEPGIEWRLPALVSLLANYERRLAAFDQRLEREKLDSLKELAYGASHEINNPLANIAARAQTMLHDETDPQRRRKLTAIHRQAMRAHEMISDLMLFARPPKLQRTTCDLRDVAQQVVDELAELAGERQIELRCEPTTEPVRLEVDETQLAVAIQALVTNSLEAVGAAGHIEVAVRQNVSEGHAWAEVAVSDDGPGISDEVRRHMFDPFYSGREAGRGLGFGLSKCWRIVTDHGGQMIVGQSSRRGAELTILLPLVHQPVHL
jgi:signal transduction histidine kinase